MAFSKITQCKQPPVVLKTRQKQSIRSVTYTEMNFTL